jgi:hypothetical protein
MRFPTWTGAFFLSSLGGGHLVAAGIASDQFTFVTTTTATTTERDIANSLEQQQNDFRYLRTSHTDEETMMTMDAVASTTAPTVMFGTQLIRTIESTVSGAAVAIQSSVTRMKKKKDAAADWDALPIMEYEEDAIFWNRMLSHMGASLPTSSPTPAPATPPPESCPVNVSIFLQTEE